MRRKVRSEKQGNWQARRKRIQRRIGRSDRVRLTVFRSAKHTYAQLCDPQTGQTLASVSTRTPAIRGAVSGTGNIDAAKRVGAAVAEIARERNIEEVVFNRNGFLYHGRIKALAEAARGAGLKF
jgi:large subunit ribosomal protein L18